MSKAQPPPAAISSQNPASLHRRLSEPSSSLQQPVNTQQSSELRLAGAEAPKTGIKGKNKTNYKGGSIKKRKICNDRSDDSDSDFK